MFAFWQLASPPSTVLVAATAALPLTNFAFARQQDRQLRRLQFLLVWMEAIRKIRCQKVVKNIKSKTLSSGNARAFFTVKFTVGRGRNYGKHVTKINTHTEVLDRLSPNTTWRACIEGAPEALFLPLYWKPKPNIVKTTTTTTTAIIIIITTTTI